MINDVQLALADFLTRSACSRFLVTEHVLGKMDDSTAENGEMVWPMDKEQKLIPTGLFGMKVNGLTMSLSARRRVVGATAYDMADCAIIRFGNFLFPVE